MVARTASQGHSVQFGFRILGRGAVWNFHPRSSVYWLKGWALLSLSSLPSVERALCRHGGATGMGRGPSLARRWLPLRVTGRARWKGRGAGVKGGSSQLSPPPGGVSSLPPPAPPPAPRSSCFQPSHWAPAMGRRPKSPPRTSISGDARSALSSLTCGHAANPHTGVENGSPTGSGAHTGVKPRTGEKSAE